MSALDDLRECARSWEPEARLLGNVRACEIVELCDELARVRERLKRADEFVAALMPSACTPAERKLLDAMKRATPATLQHVRDAYKFTWVRDACSAELARRAEESK